MSTIITQATPQWLEEENLKERVYLSLTEQIRKGEQLAQNAEGYYYSGAFEEQESSFVLGKARRERANSEELKNCLISLLRKPYYARMDVYDEEDESTYTVLHSASEELNHLIDVGEETYILPFIQGAAGELRKSYARHELSTFANHSVRLIRDIDIENRTIKRIVQHAPEITDAEFVLDDEVLSQRIEENRSDPRLKNIISTLLKEQYEVILENEGTSFVLQGCAGSGKSQILIHRLFFLRETLEKAGWRKVLLITPTQLFREYSRELIARYHLSDVENCSISGFYQSILLAYDARFKDRHYAFELTEEYLPDQYLNHVYSADNIARIRTEIASAIRFYVSNACRLTGDECPEKITSGFVESLAEKLSQEISNNDRRDVAFSNQEEYLKKRSEVTEEEKKITSCERRINKYTEECQALEEQKKSFYSLKDQVDRAASEYSELEQEQKNETKEVLSRFSASIRCIEQNGSALFSNRIGYIEAYYDVLSLTRDTGVRYQYYQEILALALELHNLAKKELSDFLEGVSSAEWILKLDEKIDAKKASILAEKQQIEDLAANIEEHNLWLREFAASQGEVYSSNKRAELTKARAYMRGLESYVFDFQVWNALEPMKRENGIKTLEIGVDRDGHKTETKILYKSDLLFYTLIYHELRGKESLPPYEMICIDEGQDLHSIDYQILHQLYPAAKLNVFGDTAQSLHENCGIRDWKIETGIEKIYSINKNLRNTAAIVDFCNARFMTNMEGYGSVREDQRPVLCSSAEELPFFLQEKGAVLIVRDKEAFLGFCEEAKVLPDMYAFFDTKAVARENGKIPCYSIFAAKGLEFSTAVIYAKGMTENQKVVACTRGMAKLVYFE